MLLNKLLQLCQRRPNMAEVVRRTLTTESPEVVFTVRHNKGIITLNRPKALNALNLTMAKAIYPVLKQWESEKLSLVIIEGTGEKAFCAGGDIRAITSDPKRGSVHQAEFFAEEYKLNNLIGTLRIPYVALINGITMGGGVGLSVHGKYRVATEKTVFAMPETGIGLFPDVGGSHFLPRLQGELGTFLALSGHRLKGADVKLSGIATHLCKSDEIATLKKELLELPGTISIGDIESVLSKFSEAFSGSKFSLQDKVGLIDSCFNADTVEHIFEKLKSVSGSDEGKKWSHDLVLHMLKMSPTSMKVTLRQLREGRKLSTLHECLEMEYRLVRRFCQDSDFYEGVRSVLVDRDGQPKWNPDSLDKVSKETVDRYFANLPDAEELKLTH